MIVHLKEMIQQQAWQGKGNKRKGKGKGKWKGIRSSGRTRESNKSYTKSMSEKAKSPKEGVCFFYNELSH